MSVARTISMITCNQDPNARDKNYIKDAYDCVMYILYKTSIQHQAWPGKSQFGSWPGKANHRKLQVRVGLKQIFALGLRGEAPTLRSRI